MTASSSSSAYQDVRAAIVETGSDARVEVNQRALIDKILARYASAGAVYRELLQNSNDAEATTAEIIITTSSGMTNINKGEHRISNKDQVTQVIYRNNGHPFRTQDWDRLRKIAEGNPDETKVGAFGVGAYTMFSICEEPLVISGKRGQEDAMFFFWKGDGLWTKTGKAPDDIVDISASLQNGENTAYDRDTNNWTSFILPSRDPYPLPDLVEFGQFLTASLTFTQCLRNIKLYVNNTLQMNIQKTVLESHTISTPKASSWWKNDGAVTYSTSGMFTLGKADQLTQTSILMCVSVRKSLSPDSEMETSNVKTRYASAVVKTKIPSDVEKRMIRVTKKYPPKELSVQIFLDAADIHDQEDDTTKSKKKRRRADQITDAFSPKPGSGRIFIGFGTSQTTGLGIHLSAPFMPTVEREAIDFVDPALRAFNMELLEISGILMRLALEHEMGRIGIQWDKGEDDREIWRKEEEERKMLKASLKDLEETAHYDTKLGDNDSTTIQSSLFSFASYMARGVKNTVVDVIKAVPEILGEDDETTELLNPSDERPLSIEERDAIILMKAYCPRISTPDSLVGQCIAKGFSRCLSDTTPPVLTKSGVIRGVDSRLCHHGMEAFGIPNVVRRVMLDNAREYHTVVATCPTLSMEDLIKTMRNRTLTHAELIRLLRWWPKICRIDRRVGSYGASLKESICYEHSLTNNQEEAQDITSIICKLDSILYYTSDKMIRDLPLPDTAFDRELQKMVGLRNLEDKSFIPWFSSLPFDIWAAFISSHPSLTKASFDDQRVKVQVLVALSKHYEALGTEHAKRSFINLLPVNAILLPIETHGKNSIPRASYPTEIYLSSSDLSAFEGLGKFDKVSGHLNEEGVSDEFLLALGVRKTISMEFLFLHIETLQWSNNPKNLIEYLMNADLSQQDLHKLRCTKYLPAKNDKDALYSPRELYLQNDELKMFSFVRFLQWPAGESISLAQRNFLTKTLGVCANPPLSSVMTYLQTQSAKKETRDEVGFKLALQYLIQKLGPDGIYEKEFSQYRNAKFLPCIRKHFDSGKIVKEVMAPSECFYNQCALVMGFSVLDPELDTITLATRTRCLKDPPPQLLIKRLSQYVSVSKEKVANLDKCEEKDGLITNIIATFDDIFAYLSSRTSDFDKTSVTALSKMTFIPYKYRGQLVFYTPSQVFFKGDESDSLAGSLFKETEYNTFLSLVGVKAEPTLHELFDLMLQKPDEVLDSLGEKKYKALLCRIASNPPFKKLTNQIRDCAFLLGYLVIDKECSSEDQSGESELRAQYVLARAEDIYIIDNSFLRRQFSMLVSPMEQQLEEFYNSVGSRYVSEVVKKEYEVLGRQRDTSLTDQFASRITERRPLLLSPSISSRPLVHNAAKLLSDENLDIVCCESINAKYTFKRTSKTIPTTSCAESSNEGKTTIFITQNYDWFDVGTSIGSMILQRCQLEDAFFVSSIMEASLQTLRYRGFPVDRILRPVVVDQSSVSSSPPSSSSPMKPVVESGAIGVSKANTNPGDTYETNNEADGFDYILSQMFPHFPLDVIQERLGANPTKEKAKEIANELCCMDFSDAQNGDTSHSRTKEIDNSPRNYENKHGRKEVNQSDIKAIKKKSGGIMGRMMGGLRSGNVNGSMISSRGKRIVQQQASEQNSSQSDVPSSPENDAISQQSLEVMLQDSVQSTRSVQSTGVSAPETVLKTLPRGLECGSEGCEVIPEQDIVPFKGPHGNYSSKNGIRVFNSRHASSTFLAQNFYSVDHFAVIIQQLTVVYNLGLSQVAIFYDPSGNTIAFNSNKALYFNVRYFVNIHSSKNDMTAYSYWYTVMAHELAHNLVTAHNKEHGKFTESIIALYLPGFVSLLNQLVKPL